MRRLPAFVLLAAALLISACTATAPSSAPVTATRHLDPNHVTAVEALGDITTVSPCSLLDPAALSGAYGTAQTIASDNIDDCAVSFPRAPSGAVVAIVGTLEKLPAEPTETEVRPSGMRFAPLRNDSAACEEMLLFADDTGMHATVTAIGDGNRTGLCDLTTALLDQVVATIARGGVRHRDYPDYSFSRLTACTLLTSGDANSAGVGKLKGTGDYPAHHRCRYFGSGGTQVELDFGVRAPALPNPQWTELPIAARDSLVAPDPRHASCTVSTQWLTLDDAGPKGTTETADLVVRVPAGQPVPCDQAKNVAAAVWKKLP